MPVFAAGGEVIGSFALSSFEHRMPSAFHRKLLEIGASIVGIVLDRAKAQETLRLYQKFYEHSEEGMMITDADQKILSVNQSFLNVFGLPMEQVIGQHPRMLSSGRHDQEFYRNMWSRLLRDGHWRGEIWNRRANGDVFPELLSISTLKDADGNASHFIGIFSDLSERVQAENELREKNELLEHSNEDLEKLAYAASHDLQTPLRNMVHFAQLLERRYKGKLDKEADQFIELIVDGGKRMTNLVRDLLEYSRASGSICQVVPVDLNHALNLALKALAGQIADTGAEIEAETLPWVMGDETLLADLFQHLIHNAIKYRAESRVPRIAITHVYRPDGIWEFAVSDNGIGIESRYFEKIFDLFQRLSPADGREGTGVGLSLCRRLITRFGGEIWLESVLRQGTTFHFTLRPARGMNA